MAATKLTLGGKRFVVLPESEYQRLKAGDTRKGKSTPRAVSRGRAVTAQDRGDIAESKRRLADSRRISADELFRKLRV